MYIMNNNRVTNKVKMDPLTKASCQPAVARGGKIAEAVFTTVYIKAK